MSSTRDQSKLYLELFFWSFISLFLELFAIRWLSSDIRAFTVFKTFPLVACFVGFGLGYARKDEKAVQFTPMAILLFCLIMKVADLIGFCMWGFPSASVFQWQSLVLAGDSVRGLGIFMVFLFALLAGPMLACMYMGTRIGMLFEESVPLKAYAVNLLGAGVGSLCFTLMSFLGASPAMLMVLPCVCLFLFMLKDQKFIAAAFAVAALFVGWMPEHSKNMALAPDVVEKLEDKSSVLWSPYQRIDLTRFRLRDASNKVIGIELGVNRAFYQYYLDDSVDLKILPPTLAALMDTRIKEYRFPFQLNPGAKSVLVVGAGTGQHVDTALKMGATDVDAVEIDPVILKLGNEYNPSYASPLVHKICDDARHYFNTCKKKYDLIIFSMLDSHTVAGQGSSVRLDSYVYTKQSFERAANLLTANGVMYVSYSSFRTQIEQRLYDTLKAAYNGDVYSFKLNTQNKFVNATLAVGNPLKTAVIPSTWQRIEPTKFDVARPVLTDDWPYLYVDPTVIDFPYLTVIGVILTASIFFARKTVLKRNIDMLYWQMFFLGGAFLLLELASIARLALLFGCTWTTSAMVINCVLVLLFLANLVAMRFRDSLNTHVLYGCLFALILMSYLLPTNNLATITSGLGPIGPIVVALLTLSPMIAAGLIFPQAFAKAPSPAKGLTFNVLGSVVGGLLEYLSYFFGNSGLVLISFALYLLSYLCIVMRSKSTVATESAPAPQAQ